MLKRIFAALFAVALAVSILPVAASANSADDPYDGFVNLTGVPADKVQDYLDKELFALVGVQTPEQMDYIYSFDNAMELVDDYGNRMAVVVGYSYDAVTPDSVSKLWAGCVQISACLQTTNDTAYSFKAVSANN